jgi:hypothetical protein
MKRTASCFLLSILLLCAGSSAWATWGPFISTGTNTGVGVPSCAQASQLNIACAVRNGQSTLMVNHFNGSAWSVWTTVSGTVATDPSCTSDLNGKVYCAATTTSGQMEVAVYNGTTWGTPTTVNASLYSAPSCAGYTAGKVLCVARNSAGGLAWSLFNGTSWSAFANLTTVTVSPPSCTTDNNNGVICAVYSSGYATKVNRFAAGHWQGFLTIGGIAGGVPDCVSMNSGGQVVCFAKAWSSGVYVNRFKGGSWAAGNWTGYGGLGGEVDDNAGCTSQAPGQLLCGAIGVTDNAMYADLYNGTTWSGWVVKVGGSGFGSPSCTALGTGQVVCVIMGPNNRLTSSVGP